MSALSDYVMELRRQADLFDYASLLDSLACTTVAPDEATMRRRTRPHWTRQDGNRAEYEAEVGDIEYRNLPFFESERALASIPKRRMRTRLGTLLNKHRRTIDRFHASALEYVVKQGTFNSVAPLLVECLESHRRLWAAYRGDISWEGEIEKRHEDAVDRLVMYMPDDLHAEIFADESLPGINETATKRTIKPSPGRQTHEATMSAQKLIYKAVKRGNYNRAIIAQKTGLSVDRISQIKSEMKPRNGNEKVS